MPSPLEAFLARNSVAAAEGLPLIHTTRSYNIRSLMEGDVINPQRCDVFTSDDLNYFFVGRPAYKFESDSSQTPHWELPCCFLFESDAIKGVKRVFPFDSGAFANKRYPSYMSSIPLDRFTTNGLDAAGKIIGAFFGSGKKYLEMKPKSVSDFEQQYSIGPLDAELSAASRLANEVTSDKFDDRRFTIEIQTEDAVHLARTSPIAVVLPEIYLDDKRIIEKIQGTWGAEPLGYPMYPLSLNMYYALIYHEILEFYKRKGML